MGHLFVGELLLNESAMKDHPLTPMRDSSLVRLLTPQVRGKVGLVNRLTVARGVEALKSRLRELEADGIAHVIIDAVANDDLSIIAEASLDFPLISGGSALAMPLPALLAGSGMIGQTTETVPEPQVQKGQIVLSGSCSAMTLKQVELYRDRAASYRLNPTVLAELGIADALDWLQKQPVEKPKLIYASADPTSVQEAQSKLGVERAGQIVEQALAELALASFKLGIRRFVVAGGETSGAVAQALGVSKLRVSKEIAPGVPWTYAKIGDETVALALKSGNFGSASFFSDALQMLEVA